MVSSQLLGCPLLPAFEAGPSFFSSPLLVALQPTNSHVDEVYNFCRCDGLACLRYSLLCCTKWTFYFQYSHNVHTLGSLTATADVRAIGELAVTSINKMEGLLRLKKSAELPELSTLCGSE